MVISTVIAIGLSMEDNFLTVVELKAQLQHKVEEAVTLIQDFEIKLNQMQDMNFEHRPILLAMIDEFKFAFENWIDA